MEWSNVLSAILAGGIAGQLVTLFGGDKLTTKREYKKWLLVEKHKLYSELITVVTYTPKDRDKIDNWTYNIRDISQRIHILHDGGVSPESFSAAIETIFRLAQNYKKNNINEKEWALEMREAIRMLRYEMSLDLKK